MGGFLKAQEGLLGGLRLFFLRDFLRFLKGYIIIYEFSKGCSKVFLGLRVF